jgi:hypothetical protein
MNKLAIGVLRKLWFGRILPMPASDCQMLLTHGSVCNAELA